MDGLGKLLDFSSLSACCCQFGQSGLIRGYVLCSLGHCCEPSAIPCRWRWLPAGPLAHGDVSRLPVSTRAAGVFALRPTLDRRQVQARQVVPCEARLRKASILHSAFLAERQVYALLGHDVVDDFASGS